MTQKKLHIIKEKFKMLLIKLQLKSNVIYIDCELIIYS